MQIECQRTNGNLGRTLQAKVESKGCAISICFIHFLPLNLIHWFASSSACKSVPRFKEAFYVVLQTIPASLAVFLGENCRVNATTHPPGLDDTAPRCSLSLGSTDCQQVAEPFPFAMNRTKTKKGGRQTISDDIGHRASLTACTTQWRSVNPVN